MKDKFGYKLFDPIAPWFYHLDNWSFHKKLLRCSYLFFLNSNTTMKISWEHGVINVGIKFSNPLPWMHWLRANYNLRKRHPYEINESWSNFYFNFSPTIEQAAGDCKLSLTNLVFLAVLYHFSDTVYNAGNYSSVDMQ